jgi:hypothetical protein
MVIVGVAAWRSGGQLDLCGLRRLALIGVVARHPLVEFQSAILPQLFIAAGRLNQGFRGECAIRREIARDLLVQLDGLIHFARALLRHRFLIQLHPSIRGESGQTAYQNQHCQLHPSYPLHFTLSCFAEKVAI